ncbi:fibronectin type III domain-containing protein [Paenibacillus sp. UNC451MF]|uniref:fibronectin type III domain-containing protein n=1 Tax=Paenibacillus sp. UNC451MF TaxID=1449063 RepID=UPI000AA4359C|nr:right-handed parallel beta-helix repeat-containing protein [Paenibacillus sp. UNC451MF]
MKVKRLLSIMLTAAMALNLLQLGSVSLIKTTFAADGDFITTNIANDDYEALSGRAGLEAEGYTISPSPGTATNDVGIIGAGDIANAAINNDKTGKLLHMLDSGTGTTKFIRVLPSKATGIVTVEFDWRSDKNGADATNYRVMRVENSSGQALVELRLSDSGVNISQYVSGSNKKVVPNYEKDRWYHFKIEIDTNAQKAESFVRTSPTGTYTSAGQWGFTEAAAPAEVAQLQAYTAGTQTSSMYYDNLQVYTKISRPSAPAGVAAAAGNGQVDLSWNAISGMSYTVKRSLTSGGSYTEIATGLNGAAYQDKGVTNGVTYYYVVTASMNGLVSADSNEAAATPQAPQAPAQPSGVTAAPENGQVSLSWNAVTGAESYIVKYGTVSGGPYTDIAGVTANAYTIKGLTNNKAYFFVVAAVNEVGQSGNSVEVTAVPVQSPPPSAPAGLKATAGQGQVTLFWNAVNGAASYNVKRSTDGSSFTTIASGVTTNSYVNTGLTNNTQYYYAVTAVNSNGESVPSASVTATPVESPPVEQYNLTGFSSGNTGGGSIPETDAKYIKVYNALDFAKAINRKNGYKVVEIMNDLNLGWNEIPAEAKTAAGSLFVANIAPKTHPVLLETGVSKIYIDTVNNMTIFSANGAKIKHAGFTVKHSSNLIFRNLEFDELWEWDELSKGDYDKNDWDFMTVEDDSKVWIDHCTFNKSYDGGIDVKQGSSGVTISWSLFKGDDRSANSWVTQQINFLEQNPSSYTMYKFLRDQGLSTDDIIAVSAGQKKQHLVGATEFDSKNPNLQVTLHHNYYKDMQDRMPRLRGGNVHAYNIVMDSAGNWEAKKRISDAQAAAISSKGYHFGITSNGAISTEGGAVLVENSHIIDVFYPMRNNQVDPVKSQYTGKILAKNTIYSMDGKVFQGDSNTPDSPMTPVPAPPLEFSWSGMTDLPYSYTADDPSTLISRLTGNEGAGAGQLLWSKENWMLTSGYSSGGGSVQIPAAVGGVKATTTKNGQITLQWNSVSGASSYSVKRSTVDGSGYQTIAATAGLNYTDTTVTLGTTYYYVISASNAAGEGVNSPQVSAVPVIVVDLPSAPGSISASAGDSKVQLAWVAVSGADSYNVKRSTSVSGPFTGIATNVTATTHTDNNVTNGTTYYYVVTASNTAGESVSSTVVSATPAQVTVPNPVEGDIIVSPDGQDSNAGTVESPMSLTAALTKIGAGKTVYLRGGIYSYSAPVTIERNNSGTADARKKLVAYGSEKPVMDFSAEAFDSTMRGLQIFGSYWFVYGIEVKGAGDNGIFIGGNYNRIENVETHHNKDTGLQISRYSSTVGREEWPSYNEIINVYSHDNFDPDNGEDADGFAAKLTIGPGNVFDGCIAAYNTDDGWDLYTKTDTGATYPVIIRNSISHHNGQTSEGSTTTDSDGNGFKLGGEKIKVDHIVENSIAYQNKKHGFTFNSNPGTIHLTNNTSWANGESNFAFDSGTHVFTNNLSYQGTASDKTSGTDVDSSNVWWKNKKSTNAKGLLASNEDFVSLTPTVTRNADGSPNVGSFLKLAANSDMKGAGTPSGTDIGAKGNTPAPPQVPAAPTGLTAAAGDKQIALTWNPVSGAASYSLKRSLSSEGSYTTIASQLTGTSYMDQDLINGVAYYYVITANNAAGESSASNQASATPSSSPSTVPTVKLNGIQQVEYGKPLTLQYELSGVNVSNAIYAQDLTFQYDDSVLEFVSAKPSKENLSIVRVKQDVPGEVRIIAVSMGQAGAVNSDGPVLQLIWQAKALGQPASTAVSTKLVQLANSSGQIVQPNSASIQIHVGGVNSNELQKAINNAKALHDSAVEGMHAGYYPAGSKAILQSAIDSANAILSNSAATQQMLDSAAAELNKAIEAFEAKKYAPVDGDLNDDLIVNIGDLAIIAGKYGMKSDSQEWNQYEHLDFNHDGTIDITDLVHVANLIE